MDIKYTYISSSEFVESLAFDFVGTYSFQRGEEYKSNLEELRNEFGKLKAKKHWNGQLPATEELRFSELDDLVNYSQYLITKQGRFHPSAQKTGSFERSAPIVNRLLEILRTNVEVEVMALCAPTYRDGIVFYNKQQEIVAVLNVCLSCQYMETSKFNYVRADSKTYKLLRQYFTDIGHKVERH